MYTRCPHCQTVFVVGAEQLKAAHGNVRCGTCLASFDAIPHLSDGPVPATPATDSPPGDIDRDLPEETGERVGVAIADRVKEGIDEGIEEPIEERVEEKGTRTDAVVDHGFDAELAEEIARGLEEDARATTTAPARQAHEPKPLPPRSDSRSAAEQLSSTLDAARAAASQPEEDEHPVREETPPPPPTESPTAATPDTGGRVSVLDHPEDEEEEESEDLPDVLREEMEAQAARVSARRRNVVYGIAAVALLVLLAAQYVFFMPDDAVRRYPQWRSAIESMCINFGCVLPERRSPERIRVVSRDVRVHPRIEGVMQIKATLTNTAPYRQPYPLVRFTLFNVNGQIIATRDFEPSEYLGRPVAASARLRPETPFQVELDVLAPEEAAVSFEFQFL